jgi:hypothetical protein
VKNSTQNLPHQEGIVNKPYNQLVSARPERSRMVGRSGSLLQRRIAPDDLTDREGKFEPDSGGFNDLLWEYNSNMTYQNYDELVKRVGDTAKLSGILVGAFYAGYLVLSFPFLIVMAAPTGQPLLLMILGSLILFGLYIFGLIILGGKLKKEPLSGKTKTYLVYTLIIAALVPLLLAGGAITSCLMKPVSYVVAFPTNRWNCLKNMGSILFLFNIPTIIYSLRALLAKVEMQINSQFPK